MVVATGNGAVADHAHAALFRSGGAHGLCTCSNQIAGSADVCDASCLRDAECRGRDSSRWVLRPRLDKKKFLDFDTVAFSFLFDKYCLIME